MAIEVIMPRLGWTMEEGIFGAWLMEDGARVEPGDLLFTVEGDKATQEVESLESGILRLPPDAPRGGETILVGTLLAWLVEEGEEPPFAQAESAQVQSEPAAAEVTTPAVETPVVTQQVIAASSAGNGALPAISPRARRIARELGVDWTTLQGSGRTGRIVERDVRAALETANAQSASVQSAETAPVRATPVAQRMAREEGIDLAQVTPRTPGARIQRDDVQAELTKRVQPATTQPANTAAPAPSAGTAQPHSRMRRVIAQRMLESAQNTAPVTLHTDVDATEFVQLRNQLRAAYARTGRAAPGYNDLLIKLTTIALLAHPALNATWQEDAVQQWQDVHMGVAVDVNGGLVVPVVRDTHTKSAAQIALQSRDLIARAQAGTLLPEEMQDGTFTITNLGMFNIDAFTPIINLPQCAILGVGRIQARPAVKDGAIVPRQMMTLSLTFDHRVVDGAPAARFLNMVREFIEEPVLWLAE